MLKPDVERRMYKRVAAEVNIRFLLPLETFDKVFTGSTFDIGRGGVGLIAEEPLKDGTAMIVEICPRARNINQDPLRLQAQCIWCEPKDGKYHIGIMFYYFDEELRARVAEFVDALDAFAFSQ